MGIDTADLLIADLTDLNPNVFYELGIAHGLGIPTVLLTQSITTFLLTCEVIVSRNTQIASTRLPS